MPDYEKYGFRNTVVDRLINRPVFNANKMPTKRVAQARNLEQEENLRSFSQTLNVPVSETRTNLGDNSVMTYATGVLGSGIKALLKLAGKNLAKKAAAKGASKVME